MSPVSRLIIRIPPHEQIADYFRRAIDDGRFEHGDRLPTRRQVKDDFGVGIDTVTKAFKILNAQRYVHSEAPHGTWAIGPEFRGENKEAAA